jgi:hypothetical protein
MKAISVYIDDQTHNAFQLACVRAGVKMSEVLVDYARQWTMEQGVEMDNGPVPFKRVPGRRVDLESANASTSASAKASASVNAAVNTGGNSGKGRGGVGFQPLTKGSNGLD